MYVGDLDTETSSGSDTDQSLSKQKNSISKKVDLKHGSKPPGELNVTGPAKIDHVSANYTKLYFH